MSALRTAGFNAWTGTHITFEPDTSGPSRKTLRWTVNAKSGAYLGDVKWFARWREYCFYAEFNGIFEQTCLREIAEFIEARTREHRANARR